MTLTVVRTPTQLPISVSQAKAFCRVDGSDEDALFDAFVRASVDHLEMLSGRCLVSRRVKLSLDRFPYQVGTTNFTIDDFRGVIRLPMSPVWCVNEIRYLDADRVWQTWDSSKYTLEQNTDPSVVTCEEGETYPETYLEPGCVVIEYECGYAAPFSVSASVLTVVNRTMVDDEVVNVWTQGSMPTGLSADKDYFVVNSTGATCQLSLTEGGDPISISGGSGVHFVGNLPKSSAVACHILTRHLWERGEKSGVDVMLRPMVDSFRAMGYA